MRWTPGIVCVALAGCNQIFGLNDTVTFVDAPALPVDGPPPVFGDCIVDGFDTLDPAVWTRIVPGAGLTVHAVGGELAIEDISTSAGSDGVISGSFGFRGGSVDVEVIDRISQELVTARLELRVAASQAVFVISLDRLQAIALGQIGTVGSGGDPFSATDRFWRITHDEPSARLVMQSSPDGSSFEPRHLVDASALDLEAVTVALLVAVTSPGAGDRVAFDNFKLTGFCPP